MPNLYEVVGHHVPLTRSGEEWRGVCPMCAGELQVIGERWLCRCDAHAGGDDALGFLRAIGVEDAEHKLANGYDWTPALTAPEPKRRYSLAEVEAHPDKPVLICDDWKAARVFAEKLRGYVVYCWPGGGRRYDALEPLRGRRVLLWPSTEDMERLEAILADPDGLGCTGTTLEPQGDLPPLDGEQVDLLAWAKAHKRDLRIPAPRVAVVPSSSGDAARKAEAVSNLPPETPAPVDAGTVEPSVIPDQSAQVMPLGSAMSDAEPPSHPDLNPPPMGEPRPKRGRLRVVGGGDMGEPDPEDEPTPHELSESGIAAHFVALHKDTFRTVHEWAGKQGACWMAWDGTRWQKEYTRVSAMQKAQTLCNGVKYWDKARSMSEGAKFKFESKKFMGAVLDLASYAPEFVAKPAMFDADKMLLGTPGGTVDLRTGKLIEAEREHYITRQTAVTPEKGPHPLFDNVIERMCKGDDSLRGYIWRSLGYSITADQREEVFWFLHGKPQSGKSTLIKTVAEILGKAEEGGYAATFDMELFTDNKQDRGSERLAHLHGARFAWASETEEGKHFKIALLKLATGGDSMSGRFLYQEKFTFEPTHHLWIFGNERIHLKSADAGIKRRLHMVEYPGVISEEERDNTLKERLKAEYPAILHSLIQGCLDWQMCGGLGKPEQISEAVDRYMEAEDEVSAWMEECCDRGAGRVSIGDAFRSFTTWADKSGAFLLSAKRFSGELEKRGFDRAKSNGVRYVLGLTIRLGANL